MSDITEAQAALDEQRAGRDRAEQTMINARRALAAAEADMLSARRLGGPAALHMSREHLDQLIAAEAHSTARFTDAALGLDTAIRDLIDRHDASGAISQLRTDVPIALLPVRIESRFSGSHAAPILRIRIYPDDIHVDGHEPALADQEVEWGRAYWSAKRADPTEVTAWPTLIGLAGPHRAQWIREQLQPIGEGEPLEFPDPPRRQAGSARPAMARLLPDVFVVRVRAAGTEIVRAGRPVADNVQVGIDLSNPNPTADLDGDTIVLAEPMRWISDYRTAVSAGLAVTVPLPSGTRFVDDITVIGAVVSLSPGAAADNLAALIAHHRVSGGTAFVEKGTPTNNVEDTASGFIGHPVAGPDPMALDQPGPASNATVLAHALGLDSGSLDAVIGGVMTDDRDAEAMQRALFEATWGPFLRQFAQPSFPIREIPGLYGHLTRFVRGGGPLPSLRVGNQPYGILPIQPSGWVPGSEDDVVSTWLGNRLPGLRHLWLAGRSRVPSGLAMLSHEAVSSRVRIRSAIASSTLPLLGEYGLTTDGGVVETRGLQERRLAAEVGLVDSVPNVLSQIFSADPADLWLPFAGPNDLRFDMMRPEPKSAESITALLLRNAALQVTSAAADELRASMTLGFDPDSVAYRINELPVAVVPTAATVAASTTPVFATSEPPVFETVMGEAGKDHSGQVLGIGEHLARLASPDTVVDLERYSNSDAVVAFAQALRDIEVIPAERRGELTAEALDCASHRYDAWVTSLATRRLQQLRAGQSRGLQVGAWGYVAGVERRSLIPLDRADLPAGTVADPVNSGFVLAPSLRHAVVAGVLRSTWAAHGGDPTDGQAPFATNLSSRRIHRALDLAKGMRNGQQLGALLGYSIERQLHDASGAGLELDSLVFQLRRRFPLRVTSGDNAGPASSRLVTDGWKLVQEELADPGTLAFSLGSGQQVRALQTVFADAIDALDALTDVGLAEGMYQLAGRNYERASAAVDMLGRAGLPPDEFGIAETPRGGRAIEQRLIVSFAPSVRPNGYASDTPRARLAAEADAFVAARLGAIDAIDVRLVDPAGTEVGRCRLVALSLSALDIGADAEADQSTPPMIVARARSVIGVASGTSAHLGRDPDVDSDLIDLLERAAAWHRVLAGRAPLGHESFELRGAITTLPNAVALDQVQAFAHQLNQTPSSELWRWGIFDGAAAEEVERRLANVAQATDGTEAARALFGSHAVVSGTVPTLPPGLSASLDDQGRLGVADNGAVERWLLDTARVREAARALDTAHLLDQLAGHAPVPLACAQTPVLPYLGSTDRTWVGMAFPAPLGPDSVVSIVVAGGVQGAGPVTGIELDAWVEVVPDLGGPGAVAANLRSPDSRAPNVVLLAVPADSNVAWSQEALFSVVDEAIELAECRLVDLDATARVPAFLPAAFVRDFREPERWVDTVRAANEYPRRYRRMSAQ